MDENASTSRCSRALRGRLELGGASVVSRGAADGPVSTLE
jgi:hypothetical protein